MAETRRFDVTKEQSLGNFPSNVGNGKDDHSPIGYHASTGHIFRILTQYGYTWTDISRIVSARVYFHRANPVNHIARGANARVLGTVLTGSWSDGGGAEGSWTAPGGAGGEIWPGPSTLAGVEEDSANLPGGTGWMDWDITDLICEHAPTTVLRPDGVTACGGRTNRGFRWVSYDPASGSRADEFDSIREGRGSYIIVTYEVAVVPDAPVWAAPAAGSTVALSGWHATFTADDSAGFTGYDIQLGTDSLFSTHYDVSSTFASHAALIDNTYTTTFGGHTMVRGGTYFIRARTYNAGGFSAWSSP